MIKSIRFVKAVLDDLVGFRSTFPTLIAPSEFTPQRADVPNTLLGDSLADLSVGELLTDANVHLAKTQLKPWFYFSAAENSYQYLGSRQPNVARKERAGPALGVLGRSSNLTPGVLILHPAALGARLTDQSSAP